MAELPKLYFVFPYRGVGGVSLLFLRLAEELARTRQADCVLVDYPDGFMAQHRDPALTKLAAYADDGAVEIPGDAIAIFQSMTPWSIFPGLCPQPETRLLFWNCHPYNLVPTLPGFRAAIQSSRRMTGLVLSTLLRSYRRRMRRFAMLLLSKNSLVFMDRENLDTTARFLGLAIAEPRFLPIGAPSAEIRPAKLRASAGLHVAWIGRLVDFKYPILDRTIRELDRVAGMSPTPISMTVVGTGAFADRLAKLAAELRLPITLIDHLPPADVELLLRNEVDLLVAMGTSALEGAKVGVPTILVDFAYKAVPKTYRFQWLADRDGLTLGDFISSGHLGGGSASLDQRLAELENDPAKISQRTYDYFTAHHALSEVTKKLMVASKTAQCRWHELASEGLLRRGVVYRLFRAVKRVARY